jgi:hypothetical protein
MDPDKQRLVEQRAYALWQAEGKPHGKHEEHWQRAVCEIEAEDERDSPATRSGPRRTSRRDAVRSRASSSRQRKRAEGLDAKGAVSKDARP